MRLKKGKIYLFDGSKCGYPSEYRIFRVTDIDNRYARYSIIFKAAFDHTQCRCLSNSAVDIESKELPNNIDLILELFKN